MDGPHPPGPPLPRGEGGERRGDSYPPSPLPPAEGKGERAGISRPRDRGEGAASGGPEPGLGGDLHGAASGQGAASGEGAAGGQGAASSAPTATGAGDAEQRRRDAEALARARRRRFLAETALSLALPLVAWKSGLAWAIAGWCALRGPALNESGEVVFSAASVMNSPAGWIEVGVFAATLLLLYRVVLLPLNYFAGYRLSRRYGLTTQSLGAWLVDWLKVTAIGVTIGTLLAVAFYACVGLLGASWWWAYALLLTGAVVVFTYVAPYVLLPLFYRLRPLEQGPLVERIDALFARAGVRQPRIAAIDLSARSTAANAAVIGFGTSRRVVLGDTLLESFTLDEIETVVAHELGHHVRGDIWRGLGLEVGTIWVGLGLAALPLAPLFRLLGWGDWQAPANFVVLGLLLEVAGLVMLPLMNGFSRHVERAADRYALDLTQAPAAFVAAMRKLASQNLIEPEPPRWAELLLYTHPPVAQRVRAAEEAHGHA
ncbi:MAG TPA: M48 family metallopeptidase [Chloroflexota bacterium]|nr:M48 family metallopeptidase [Chloroflexota bacterium]